MSAVKCDILITGAGLAGLSLLYRAMKSGIWKTEKIIIVDKSDKSGNDKTWSFWKTVPTDFEDIIHHQWKDLVFYSNDGKKIPLKNGGYTYNSIKSIDFYLHIISALQHYPNISFVQDDIIDISSSAGECKLITPSATYLSKYLFNSIYIKPQLLKGEQYFLQHFKGIRIKTDQSAIPVTEAYLMDFRTGQEHGTTFFYTLPMAKDELFIEYTLFSASLLPLAEYDRQIRIYLTEILKIDVYEILEEEFGFIPMTDHQFKRFEGNIIHIGTAGGDTRASTGYTFTNTQKTIDKIINSVQSNGHPFFETENIGVKAQLYDSALLLVLAKRKYEGYQLFYDLFSKTSACRIFAFLDAETSVFEDMHIMKSLRVFPFLQSFTAAVYRRLFPSKM